MAFLLPLAGEAAGASAVAGEATAVTAGEAGSTEALSGTQFAGAAKSASSPEKEIPGGKLLDSLGYNSMNPLKDLPQKEDSAISGAEDAVSHSDWNSASDLGSRVSEVMSPRQFG